MAGAVWGLVLGLGLACIWWSFWPRAEGVRARPHRRRVDHLADEIVLAGVRGLGPWTFIGSAVALALLALLLVLAVTGVWTVSLCFAVMALWAPFAVVRSRARRRRTRLRDVWPDAVDHVQSAVRAGLALPEALVQLGERGPEELRPQFVEFTHDYRATGRFSESLDRLKDRLSDPVADRLVEALRIARDVGGTDLGKVLRALTAFLREDARARAELEARQSWTVNAARLAMAAPWAVLLLLASRGSTLDAYSTPAGALVLAVGAAVTVLAYQLMVRLGRLPEEQRVLR
ncbi:type II secretion system F family protein [Ornithinimicrobium pekingense]|uniref:Type II secretion system protein F n=1 Tax=Ornithinimicrobium pekingense TaxID=384677 RepID=A0ABQ2F8V4_9MICO|nr:type II secretion system F family protein [Ornithinimicrobium pekingense]GGK64015.1 type II secretion system protein F [Ornithinimicrobium pekingense]